MIAHWQYLMYVLRHKRYVYWAGRVLGVSRWQLLIHDLSKLSPAEWFPYVDRFHKQKDNRADFDRAVLHHYHANPHHWEHWVLHGQPLRMPYKYTAEMVADWIGAGLALGKPDVWGWYAANKDKQQMHPTTRETVEALLDMYAEKMPA